ncbi:hypothetical protein [Hymenobacter ruricola]|uniref:Periplasmic heavy metal sensor n=1 Tax=Hymenobacter ruricola TaxID=2791023 RepID=A0ABS0I5M4_9BACT|nr:hypothetical protein [Hymenobacter ruricola]MBF9222215.1 hypothetical protein [Hymenobacter ruricola]
MNRRPFFLSLNCLGLGFAALLTTGHAGAQTPRASAPHRRASTFTPPVLPTAPAAPAPSSAQARRAAYHRAHVAPAFQRLRQQVAAVLSAQDRELVDSVQAQMRDIRRRAAPLQDAVPAGRPVPLTDSGRQALAQLGAEHRQAMARLAPLAAKHARFLAALVEELAPQRARWLQDLAAIPRPELATDPTLVSDQQLIDQQLRPEVLLIGVAEVPATVQRPAPR